MESKELAEKIAEILDSKKGIDIEIIDVTGKTTLADYFVFDSKIHYFAYTVNTLAKGNLELCFTEWRGYLILDHLHPG